VTDQEFQKMVLEQFQVFSKTLGTIAEKVDTLTGRVDTLTSRVDMLSKEQKMLSKNQQLLFVEQRTFKEEQMAWNKKQDKFNDQLFSIIEDNVLEKLGFFSDNNQMYTDKKIVKHEENYQYTPTFA